SVPDWAATAVVEVEVPREQWREFTDFGVTEFDSTGQQVSQGPLEYAFGRQAFAVPPALRGHPLTVELYPGFARDKGVHPWRGKLRVRFLPIVAERRIKITANAGGVNPRGCAQAVAEVARRLRLSGKLRIGVVTGDDLLGRLDGLLARGHELRNLDTNRRLADVRDRV